MLLHRRMDVGLRPGAFVPFNDKPVPIRVFRFLETLPSLAIVDFDIVSAQIRIQDLHLLATIAQKTVLSEVNFALQYESVASGAPTVGPEGLESLSVKWNVRDDADNPGSSMAHLSAFLRPSLCTLTCLKLRDYDPVFVSDSPPDPYFHHVRRTYVLLHRLEYTTRSPNTKSLEVVARLFPNLTYLSMEFNGYRQSECAIWTVYAFVDCWFKMY